MMLSRGRKPLNRQYGLWLVLVGAVGGCSELPTGGLVGQTEIEVLSGNNQIGVFGELLPEPIVVRVTVGGTAATGLPVDWWAIPPRLGPHLYSDLCGYPSTQHFTSRNTFTDEDGESTNYWRGSWVEEVQDPQDCVMRIRAFNPERDSVLAVDSVFATWEYR